MRGPVTGVSPLLQPVAHALLQAVDEVEEAMASFDQKRLWIKPAGMASVGFHLLHIRGVIDRLFTYAKGESLTPPQFDYLEREQFPTGVSTAVLVGHFRTQVDNAIAYLANVNEDNILAPRGIGRHQIPTNMLGLLFHAAEHTQRHVGQLLVTARWVMQMPSS